jgi:3',5'-cyclic AMP phosphodiesterase CpdA
MIRLLIFAFVLLGFMNSPAIAQKKNRAGKNRLRIVQISDVQLGLTYAYAQQNKLTEILADSSNLQIDHQFFKKAVSEINRLNPDIIVNTGDLVNDGSDTTLIQDYKDIAAGFKAPLYIAMGNHDGWNTSEIATFRKRFSQDEYYSLRIHNFLFIFLNSWYLKYPDRDTLGTRKQKDFVQETLLQNADAAYKIMLFHIPAYLSTPQEEETYTNLSVNERNWLLNLALKNQVRLFLSGHAHFNSVQNYKDSITLITTGSIAKSMGENFDGTPSKRGFRMINIDLKKGIITHEFIPLTDQ